MFSVFICTFMQLNWIKIIFLLIFRHLATPIASHFGHIKWEISFGESERNKCLVKIASLQEKKRFCMYAIQRYILQQFLALKY